MDRYFGKDEIEDLDGLLGADEQFTSDSHGLPIARKIERNSFSLGDSFNVDKFLTDHHHYQTLEDIQEQLQKWSTVLEKELVDLINQDYSKFVGLGESLNVGHPKVQDIKMEVLSFQNELKVRTYFIFKHFKLI